MRLAILMGSLGIFTFSLVQVPQADEADVVAVRGYPLKNGTWRFDVTVRHADEGWNHYASGWEIVGPDGQPIAKRVLRHPHVKENPFTRSLPGVKIPSGVEKVTVRAKDKVHGYGGAEQVVNLTQRPAVGVPVEDSSEAESPAPGRTSDESGATGPMSYNRPTHSERAGAHPDLGSTGRSTDPLERSS